MNVKRGRTLAAGCPVLFLFRPIHPGLDRPRCVALHCSPDTRLTALWDPAAMTAADISSNTLRDASANANHLTLTQVTRSTDFGGILAFSAANQAFAYRSSLAGWNTYYTGGPVPEPGQPSWAVQLWLALAAAML